MIKIGFYSFFGVKTQQECLHFFYYKVSPAGQIFHEDILKITQNLRRERVLQIIRGKTPLILKNWPLHNELKAGKKSILAGQ